MSIQSNLETVKGTIPSNVKLVAVSKFHPEASLLEAYDSGQRSFGESRVQELDSKQKSLPKDIEWHMIGHLQSNKIKMIVPYIHTIQSVDSWKLLLEINNYAQKVDRKINCLLQIHIAKEECKYGFSFDTCREMLDADGWKSLAHVQIAGVMGMATNTDDMNTVREEFKILKHFYNELKDTYFSKDPFFKEISMGMSHDYKIAIEEGATIVRVGSAIFGQRN